MQFSKAQKRQSLGRECTAGADLKPEGTSSREEICPCVNIEAGLDTKLGSCKPSQAAAYSSSHRPSKRVQCRCQVQFMPWYEIGCKSPSGWIVKGYHAELHKKQQVQQPASKSSLTSVIFSVGCIEVKVPLFVSLASC